MSRYAPRLGIPDCAASRPFPCATIGPTRFQQPRNGVIQ